jgi:hypothetical protein
VKRKLLLAGGAISLVVLAIAVAAGADDAGDNGSEWSGVIDEARHQMESQAFDGVVVVEWHDPTGSHRTQMEVRQHAGVVEVVNEDRTVASDSSRVMLDGQAWTMLSRAKGGGAVPDLTRGKYEVVRSTGPVIAGQPTTRYEAKRDENVVERLFVQDATGLVLRREVFDARGDVVRSVSFMRMNTVTEPSEPPSTAASQPGPQPVDHLERPYRDPSSAGNGYRLLGRWEHRNDLAQLYYTDGVLSVSVFEQPGRLDWSVLPRDGDSVEIGGRPARRYALPVGDAWVFERGGVVYTCVGDAAADEVAAIAADVSAPEPSRAARFAELVVDPFSW